MINIFKTAYYISFFFITILFSFCSCNDSKPKVSSGPVKEISKIHFYIDNSASMGGYFNDKTEFDEIVAEMAAKINKQIKPLDIFFIADSIIPYTKPVEGFGDDIAQTSPAHQKSSQLQNMIKQIADHNDSNDVSLLVSDCILSFPDEAIKNNKNINQQKAPSLKNDVYQTFYDLKAKGVATTVYAFTSKFYSNAKKGIYYYDYQNNKKILNGEERPFYIWVIANKDLLVKFNSKINDISGFKPEKSLDFGLSEQPITKYDVATQSERIGDWNWSKNDSTIGDINVKKSAEEFTIALDCKSLPLYAQDVNYIQTHLQLAQKGCEATFKVKDKQSIDKSKFKSNQQKELYEDASHFIVFTVNSMMLPTASIEVTLPKQYDTWYTQWSTMDDTKEDSLKNKTFAFEYLINGVKDAYETKNTNYIDCLIKLKQ
ncbi:MAG TPA: hypothetical protein VIJ92_15625 [Ginsengibacter sp.]